MIEPFFFVILLVFILVAGLAFAIGRASASRVAPSSYQNKLAAALRHLDIAAIPITEIETVSQEIVDIVYKELGYSFGAIALVDNEAGGLRRIAISRYPELDEVIRNLPITYQKQVVSFDQADNLLIKALKEKKNVYTDYLHDIQRGVFPAEFSDALQKTLGIKGLFIYPLFTKNGPAGVMYYCTIMEKERISAFELGIMDEFTRQASMALDNVFLYHHLKETSRQLVGANEQLKGADKLKDDFVSIASHELRTPMTAIRSYAWLALHHADVPLSRTMEKYLIRILMSTDRLIHLVNDMLNVSRIESGKIQINPELVDLHSLIRDIADEVYFSKSQEKEVQFVLSEKQAPKVFADPEKLRQVFLNIVGNCLKFTPHGGRIVFDFFTDGQMVETSISDTGVGISKDDLNRLFHKFSRLDNSYTSAATSGGTGLGLYISKNLIELMHGKIYVFSEGLGKGSIFSVILPVVTKDQIEHTGEYAIKPKKEEVKPLESAEMRNWTLDS